MHYIAMVYYYTLSENAEQFMQHKESHGCIYSDLFGTYAVNIQETFVIIGKTIL